MSGSEGHSGLLSEIAFEQKIRIATLALLLAIHMEEIQHMGKRATASTELIFSCCQF